MANAKMLLHKDGIKLNPIQRNPALAASLHDGRADARMRSYVRYAHSFVHMRHCTVGPTCFTYALHALKGMCKTSYKTADWSCALQVSPTQCRRAQIGAVA